MKKNTLKKIFVKAYTHFIPSKEQRRLVRNSILNGEKDNNCYVYDLLSKISDQLSHPDGVKDIFRPDITKCPKATGVLRLIQKVNLIFLKKITDLCEKNGLTYFINYGTLLGAVRHKGFIPWDDDVDICLLRDDYEKLIELLKNIPELQYTLADCLRIHCGDLPIHVDILPIDFYYKNITTKEEEEKFFALKEKADVEVEKHKKIDFSKPDTVWPYDDYIKIRDKFIYKEGQPTKRKDVSLFRGVETWGNPRTYYKYEWVFPLKEYEFENITFLGPNRADILLYENYGDYMAWPNYVRLHGQQIDLETFIKLTEVVENEKL